MISPTEVTTLNESEKSQAADMEVVIDAQIKAESNENPTAKSFTLLREPIAKLITGGRENVVLSLKVQHHVADAYRKAGWKVDTTPESFVFPAPESKRKGRKPGSKNKPKVEAVLPEVIPVVDAAAPAADAK